MSGTIDQLDTLSPAPILDAVERYRGTITDLDTGQVFSADAFAAARSSLAASLRRAGLAPGDRVLMAVSNGPLFIATLAAILDRGASPVLLHAKTPTAELERYASRFGARIVASDAGDESPVTISGSSTLEVEFAPRAGLRWSTIDAATCIPLGPVLRGVPLHPTSGSTGLPKIAIRPAQAALEEARHYAETMAVDADDTIVAVPPMSHAYGYGMCVMLPLLCGASLVSTRRFSVKGIASAIDNHGATILPLVPASLDVLALSGQGVKLRSLRHLLSAGAVLTRRSAQQFAGKTGITPCPLYGTTETGGISVATSADGRDVDGRVGLPMEGVEVEVRVPRDGTNLEAGVGKLFVRSSSMMAGYLDDAGQITQPGDDGWFETGDLACLAPDGTIHLRGRDSEVLNVFGLKVVPCEVEEAIMQLPGVIEAKVYGAEHTWGGQIVKAAVTVESGISETDLRAHCERQLVYYKRPQMIAVLSQLPRNPNGKIDRSRLP
jgi:long-chain acyl-CoA synthetase